MYIVVREDLSIPQQCVQSCHAAIKATKHLLSSNSPVENPNLVVCGVPDEAALHKLLTEVQSSGVRCCSFQEEDLGNQTTAFATELVSGSYRKAFKKCRLLRGESAHK